MKNSASVQASTPNGFLPVLPSSGLLRRFFYAVVWMAMLLFQQNAQAQLCTATAIAPLFGNYPSSAAGNSANGSVSVTCLVLGITPQTVFYTIQLELNSQAQLMQRRMAFGASHLNYNVFCDSGYNQIWADGTGGSCTVTGGQTDLLGNLLSVFPVYGRIPGGQFLSPGVYSDSITVKVLY